VDEAFLRRLRHKIEVRNPSYDEYREIFKRMSITKNVEYTDAGLAYLLQEWYIKRKRNLRASHPRDLCDQIIDYARYVNQEPALIKELIDQAAESYFVEV
jgi:SpoVK/Ycf46/Vps4 family AAA+-type ATPase